MLNNHRVSGALLRLFTVHLGILAIGGSCSIENTQKASTVLKAAPTSVSRCRVRLVATVVVVMGSVLRVGAAGAVSEGFSDLDAAGVHRSAIESLAADGVGFPPCAEHLVYTAV